MSDGDWKTAVLADLVEDTVGGLWGSPPDSGKSDETDVLVVRGADFRNWSDRRALDAAPRRIPFRSLERRQLEAGDLVLEVSGGGPAQPVGRVLVVDAKAVDESLTPLICSNFCRKLRLKSGVDPFFVKRQLDWLYHSGHTDRFQTSTTNIRNLQVDDFVRGTDIVLPGQVLQSRLTELLDSVDLHIASGVTHLDTARRAIERFRQAALGAACSGRLTADWRETHAEPTADDLLHELRSTEGKRFHQESSTATPLDFPDTWRIATGAEAFTFVTSGSRGWAKYYSDDGPSFIRVGNLDRHRLDLDLVVVQAVTPPSSAESKRTRVQSGDLLISITAEVGMVGVVPDDLGESYVNQHVAIARPHSQLNPRFLAAFVAAPSHGEAQLDSLQRGATKAGLGLNDIRALRIPLPPSEEQIEIAQRIDRLMSLANDLDSRIDAASDRINQTSQAVLSKAFRGELSADESPT